MYRLKVAREPNVSTEVKQVKGMHDVRKSILLRAFMAYPGSELRISNIKYPNMECVKTSKITWVILTSESIDFETPRLPVSRDQGPVRA